MSPADQALGVAHLHEHVCPATQIVQPLSCSKHQRIGFRVTGEPAQGLVKKVTDLLASYLLRPHGSGLSSDESQGDGSGV